MAYAALVSVAQTIQLMLQHDHQPSSYLLERQHITSLHDRFIFLQNFIQDHITDHYLEGRIRSLAYEAEDIIEHFISEQIRSYYKTDEDKDFKLCHYDFADLYQKLQKVTEKIETIAGVVMDIKNSSDQLISSAHSTASSSSTPVVLSPTGNEAMVGFEENLLTIMGRLCSQVSDLQVIPIFGMGGIGKTTLAMNAFNDPLTMEHFEIRAWVTISQDYRLNEIISGLLVVLKSFFNQTTTKSESLAVFQSLKGRRYLIVLDDMWSTKVWDDVKRLFPDDNNGSRVVLTTRLTDVAAYPADSSSPGYEMSLMDVDQSWNMLRQKVFKQESCPPDLENVGRMIASSCKGLPLAIAVIAGILSTVSQTLASWEKVAHNVTSAVTSNDDQFEKIISLSYVNLPHHLRPCFLYIGGFPEDYEIKVSKLIKLWVAEGFLRPIETLSYEEVAEECLEDLVRRSLILVTNRKSNGKIRSCNVHDLIRDLCIKKAQEEKFLLNAKKIHAESIKNERRVSITRSRRASIPNIHDATFRTILCFPPWHDMLSSLKDFRLLRVFDAVRLSFSEFPKEVTGLVLLRYLAFSISRDVVRFQAHNVSHLKCLQTLFIVSTKTKTGHVKCHVQFTNCVMQQLRHLILHRCEPLHLYNVDLQNLQSLAIVKNFKCSKMVQQGIPNIRKLEIVYPEDRIRWLDFQLDNLVHLHQLENLNIDVEKHRKDPVPFWENLGFPKKLMKLQLRGFRFSIQDMAIVGSLPNLQVLKLRDCSYEGGEWETTEGEFPNLKFLQIITTNLEHWETDSNHFPCLERLMLCYCENLEEIPYVIGEIPTLELIEVFECDKSLVDSAEQIKKEQRSDGNDFLQVRVMKYYIDN